MICYILLLHLVKLKPNLPCQKLLLLFQPPQKLTPHLADAVKAQTRPSNNTMIVDEPAKPVAGSSKHPDDTDVIDGELIY